MAGPEAKVKAKVKRILDKYKEAGNGVYQHWPVQTGYGAACLDCHACYNGLYLAIETKAPGKHPTPRQENTIEDIKNADGKVFVIGERIVHRKGDHILNRLTGEKELTLSDIYSGEQELIDWLEDEQR